MNTMSTVRVLDANINRAAEGMRVLEDIARFMLENQKLCEQIKNCRHNLREQAPSVFSRNTLCDVGTHLSTNQENTRESVCDIALAASNRCAEALRVVEEFLKLDNTPNLIESIRYKMYDLSAEVIRSLGSTKKQQWKLCFVLTEGNCILPWEKTLIEVLQSGCDCVQVREKHKSTKALVEHVIDVKKITDIHNVPTIINDRVDVALATSATGVHLGKSDMSVKHARTIMGSQYIIGSTVHNAPEASEAIAMGADYIGVGAMFDSPTKPGVEIGGTKLLKEVVGYNHLAIGGITTENVNELYNIGCKGIAVSSALAKSQTPGETAETLLHREAQLA